MRGHDVAVEEDGEGGSVVAVGTPAVACAPLQVRLVEVGDEIGMILGDERAFEAGKLNPDRGIWLFLLLNLLALLFDDGYNLFALGFNFGLNFSNIL